MSIEFTVKTKETTAADTFVPTKRSGKQIGGKKIGRKEEKSVSSTTMEDATTDH
jgi:hypothetical protein